MIHFSHVDSPFYYNLISFYWNFVCSKSLTANQHIFQKNPDKHTHIYTDREKLTKNDEWLSGFELSHMSDSLPNILFLLKYFLVFFFLCWQHQHSLAL